MILNASEVKQMAFELGANLCGIAPINRFDDAPAGYHPRDVLNKCESVIVLAKKFLTSTIHAKSTIPYTDVRDELSRQMDKMAIELCYQIEDLDHIAVPINAIGPNEFDIATKKKRGIISLKHAGIRAGLGKMGKNTLLINDKYGNMIWLSAVLTSAQLTPDPVANYEGCLPNCTLCLDSCPVQSLDGISINQTKCWEYAFGIPENGGGWRIKCFLCRKVCPHAQGIKGT